MPGRRVKDGRAQYKRHFFHLNIVFQELFKIRWQLALEILFCSFLGKDDVLFFSNSNKSNLHQPNNLNSRLFQENSFDAVSYYSDLSPVTY